MILIFSNSCLNVYHLNVVLNVFLNHYFAKRNGHCCPSPADFPPCLEIGAFLLYSLEKIIFN